MNSDSLFQLWVETLFQIYEYRPFIPILSSEPYEYWSFYQILNSDPSCWLWVATLMNIGPFFFFFNRPLFSIMNSGPMVYGKIVL